MNKALLAVVLLCLAVGLAAYGSPKIHVEEPIHDFGSILEGYAVTHVFTIQNTGDETLIIDRVAVSCGCTATELATDRLAPGESVDLEVLVDTAGFGGRISKSIYIYTNDPEYADAPSSNLPRFTLRVTGEVIRAQPYHTSISDMNYLFTLVIDLRDPDAYEAAHLIGAINIPSADLAESLGQLPTDSLIVLYDQDGELSPLVTEGMIGGGYQTVYYTLGGLDEWLRWHGTFFLEIAGDAPEIPETQGKSRLACPDGDRRCTDITALRYLTYLLIDLRDPADYAASHLLGSINIPHAEIAGRLDDLPKDVLVIVYDQSNEESDAVAQLMLSAGFSQARSLLGGFDEWVRQFGDRFVWASTE